MNWLIAACTTIFLLLCDHVNAKEQSLYADCTDSNECGKTQCCVLSMTRYSKPVCLEMRQKEEPCSPYSFPKETMVAKPSPNGGTINLTNVYETLCPCAPGLVCSKVTSLCEEKNSTNRKFVKKILRIKSSSQSD